MNPQDDHIATPSSGRSAAAVVELVVNLDDATGEVVGEAMRQLLDAGALDVWTAAIGMKKLRPGVMLSVLCTRAQAPALAERMLVLTGSFGVRWRRWRRLVLEREQVEVRTRFGVLRLKVGRLRGRVVVVKPEWDDVALLAAQVGAPAREVHQAAVAAAEAWRAGLEGLTP